MKKLNKQYRVLIINEGSPGHLTQSEGIVNLLQREGMDITIEQIRFNYKLRGVLRPLVRILMQWDQVNIDKWLLRWCGNLEHEPKQNPDLIISSGGKSIFASHILKKRYTCKSAFVGIPDPYPSVWFDLIISPVARPFPVPSVISGLIPNTVTPESVTEAGRKYWLGKEPSNPCWAVLIGANSRSHHYSDTDWNGLIDGLNQLGKVYGIQWLVTTSRRTPVHIEKLLDEKLDKKYIADLILFNRAPRKVMKPFLAASQRVLVSQDSLTMASEALNSGRPVTLLAPETLRVEKGSYFSEILDAFPKLPGVERISMASLANYTPSDTSSITEPTSMNEMGKKLAEQIKVMFK